MEEIAIEMFQRKNHKRKESMKEISIEIFNKKKRKRKFNWSKLLQIKIIFAQYKRPIIKHKEMVKLGKSMLENLNFTEQG